MTADAADPKAAPAADPGALGNFKNLMPCITWLVAAGEEKATDRSRVVGRGLDYTLHLNLSSVFLLQSCCHAAFIKQQTGGSNSQSQLCARLFAISSIFNTHAYAAAKAQ